MIEARLMRMRDTEKPSILFVLALVDGVSGEVGEDRARCLMAAIVVLPSRWMSSSGGGAASRSG